MADNMQYAPFEKLKVLGEGSYGKAYLVRQLSDNSMAVLKQIDMAKMSSKEMTDAFKEAEILKHLNHPCIVRIKDVLKTKSNKLWIVMEYADGGDLDGKIKLQKQSRSLFSEDLILGRPDTDSEWFTQMCLAVKHIHDRKIIHRDLKCQNIFLTKAGKIKLGDFGIAKVLSHTREISKTVIGTPYYISPEILNNHPYRFETDIWSLGVILYELMKLEPPFQAKSLQLLSLKIVKGKYDDPGSTYSKEIKAMLGGLLQVDPKRRAKLSDVLNHPLIRGRVNKYLPSEMLKDEFSHTVLHNQRINISKDKLQDQFKHLKVVNNENVAKKPETSVSKPEAPIRPVEAKKAVVEPPQKPVSGLPTNYHKPPGLSSAQGSRGSAAHLPVAQGFSDQQRNKQPEFGVQGGRIGGAPQAAVRHPGGNYNPPAAAAVKVVPPPAKPSPAEVKLQEEKQAYLRHVEEIKKERAREMEKMKEAEEKRKAEERRKEEEKRIRREKEERAKRMKAVEEQEQKARDILREREEEEIRKALEADEKRQKREAERLKMQEDIARRRRQQLGSKPSDIDPLETEFHLDKYNKAKQKQHYQGNIKVNQNEQQIAGRGSNQLDQAGNLKSDRRGHLVAHGLDSPSQKAIKPPKPQDSGPKHAGSHQHLQKKPPPSKLAHKKPWVGVGEDVMFDFKESSGSKGNPLKQSPAKPEAKPRYFSDVRIPTPNMKELSKNGSEVTRLPKIATPQRRSAQGSRRGSGSEEYIMANITPREQSRGKQNLFEGFQDSEEEVIDPERTGMGKTASFVDHENFGTASFHEFAKDIKEIHRASDQIANRFEEQAKHGRHFFEESPPDKSAKRPSSQTSGRNIMPMATGVDMITIKQRGEALQVDEDDPTYYLSGYGQLETLRSQLEKKIGARFSELYERIRELLEDETMAEQLDTLCEDPKAVLRVLGEPLNSLELTKAVTLLTKLILKEQALEESEKNNIYPQS